MLAPKGLKKTDKIITSSCKDTDIKIGNSLPLKNIPLGTLIHNIELFPNKGGQIVRAAGTYGKLIKKDLKTTGIRLNSGQKKK